MKKYRVILENINRNDGCRSGSPIIERDFDSWRSRRREPAAMQTGQPDEMPAAELSDADALAVAICHAHHRASRIAMARARGFPGGVPA